ncbi:MAG: hypothetical protein ABSA77_10900 [Thermoguttaceae bacterium]|jgi:hypothetical protein
MAHLKDLEALMGGPDEPQEKYKLHLPKTFCCGLVFFEMRKEQQFSESALAKLIAGDKFRGFFGGVILRGEGHTVGATARLSLVQSKTGIESTIGPTRQSLLAGFGMTESVRVTDDIYLGAMLMWAETNFSQFGFDVIAMMQGTYEIGRLSSFYGMGTSEWEKSTSHTGFQQMPEGERG